MPKTKTSGAKHNADFPFRKPYPIKKADNNTKPQAGAVGGVGAAAPTQTAIENVLKTYVETHKQTLQNVKQSHLAIIRKAQQKAKAICEKDEECSHLIRELHTSQSEVTKLLTTIEECKKTEDILQQNWQHLNAKFTNLEKNYDNQINNTNTIINEQKAMLDEKDKRIVEQQTELNNLQKNNENLINQIKSNTEAHEIEKSNLEMTYANLQQQNQQLASQNELLNREMNIQSASHKNVEETMIQNKQELEQQFAEFSKSSMLQMKEANNTNELLQKSLEDKNLEIQILLQQNEQLSKDLQATREKLESKTKAFMLEMDNQYKHNENVSKTYMDNEKRYQNEIDQLKAEMDRKKDAQIAQQEEIKKLEMKIKELQIFNNNLLMSKENAIKDLADEKIKYEKESELKANSFQAKLNDLQHDLDAKNQELVHLEHTKNAAIAELRYKMNKIGTVFNQSVGSATIILDSNESKSNAVQPVSVIKEPLNESSKSNKVEILSCATLMPEGSLPLESVEKPNTSSRALRTVAGRRMNSIEFSDFNGETSEDDYKQKRLTKPDKIKRPSKYRSGNAKIKRFNQTPPSASEEGNIFDQLKMSTN